MVKGLHAVAVLGLLSPLPAAAAGAGLWHYSYQNGIGEYLTGNWDSPTGGAIAISCKDGGASIMTQIKGQAPPPGTMLRLTASNRAGSRAHQFDSDAMGRVVIADAAGSTAFSALWRDLRARDIVTVRYADGRTHVASLSGAMRVLPERPCG